MKIEKGIPIPQYSLNDKRWKYDLGNMKVGQSFIFEGTKSGARSMTFRNRMRYGFNFIFDETAYGNVRVWRVA